MRAAVEAEAQRLLNEAENVLTDQARYSLFRRKLLDRDRGHRARERQADGEDRGHPHPAGRRPQWRRRRRQWRAQRDRRSDRFGAALSRPGAADRFDPRRHRRRGRQPRQDAGGLIREARDMQGIRKDTAPPKRRAEAAAPGGGGSERRGGRRARRAEAAMARVFVSTVVNARSDRVWARVRDFNGMPNWHPGDRREPHRGRRAVGQDRLRARFPAAQRRPHPREAARPLRLRHVLHLFDPRIADGGRELCRDAAADAGDRRRADLRRMDGRIRLRARARGGTRSPTSAAACSRAASTR